MAPPSSSSSFTPPKTPLISRILQHSPTRRTPTAHRLPPSHLWARYNIPHCVLTDIYEGQADDNVTYQLYGREADYSFEGTANATYGAMQPRDKKRTYIGDERLEDELYGKDSVMENWWVATFPKMSRSETQPWKKTRAPTPALGEPDADEKALVEGGSGDIEYTEPEKGDEDAVVKRVKAIMSMENIVVGMERGKKNYNPAITSEELKERRAWECEEGC